MANKLLDMTRTAEILAINAKIYGIMTENFKCIFNNQRLMYRKERLKNKVELLCSMYEEYTKNR